MSETMQLTLGKLEKQIERIKELCKEENIDWENVKVYLGDDDEMNGIHCGWDCEEITDDEESEDLVELIEERCLQVDEGKIKGVLIS